jgi:hypothetical protein
MAEHVGHAAAAADQYLTELADGGTRAPAWTGRVD